MPVKRTNTNSFLRTNRELEENSYLEFFYTDPPETGELLTLPFMMKKC